jgi:2-aminoethylphosphonate dioxygenase
MNNYKKNLENDGYLLIKDFFNNEDILEIDKFKNILDNLEETKNKWLIYYEEIDNKKMKSRIENFVNYIIEIKTFVYEKIKPLLESILEEKMVIFKDKINWKYSNGDGFRAHQDHPAWTDFNISRYYSVAVFANDTTKENGCLEIVKNKNNIGLFNESGCISETIEKNLEWEYIETTKQDLLIFDSFIPHRSKKNKTNKSRSIFYFTFNKLNEGDYYNKYVKNKKKYFPPPNEREINTKIEITNNKYNLGNPIK